MCAEELECGVCYQTYNAGRRCPRELQCKHSFCESCLLALSRPLGPGDAHLEAGRLIVCPLCRHITSISDHGKIRAELRVDESALERLTAAGLLNEPEVDDQVQEDEEEATAPETPAEESESSAGTGGGRLRRCLKKVWQAINGKGQQRREEDCMTSEDLRALAMMSCHMF
ncbi:E3 ubiquitin-protein ligase-like isoform X2 [Haplochromis burtoni]|uniref:Si:ch73-335l21.4 n=1 Tax=Haplochromis burtoni TaxID=8153 RepID=A0A3Q2W4A8_HAPBU|nr:E3 ubiquitin-protein ligase-like isoform X2 [Haplochromis burtoni]